jgi:hypothetical protein
MRLSVALATPVRYGVNRHSHVAFVTCDNVLLRVHGGFTLTDVYGDLLHFELTGLNTDGLASRAKVNRRLCELHPRAGHSAVFLPTSIVVTFGGETAADVT